MKTTESKVLHLRDQPKMGLPNTQKNTGFCWVFSSWDPTTFNIPIRSPRPCCQSSPSACKSSLSVFPMESHSGDCDRRSLVFGMRQFGGNVRPERENLKIILDILMCPELFCTYINGLIHQWVTGVNQVRWMKMSFSAGSACHFGA